MLICLLAVLHVPGKFFKTVRQMDDFHQNKNQGGASLEDSRGMQRQLEYDVGCAGSKWE